MRAILLAALLVAGGLLMATEFDWSGGSTAGLLAPKETPVQSSTPAPSQGVEGAEAQASPPPEPGATSHRPVVMEQFLCTNCHRLDGGWPLTDSHRDTAGQTCEDCHARVSNPAPVVIHDIPGDTATQALCTLCHGDVGRQDRIPAAPVVGEAESCASCHAGDRRAEPPKDHDGRSVATCTLCHETQLLAAKAVPHQVEGWQDCSFCHGPGRLTPLAGGHKNIPEDVCVRCHETVETPPKMPLTMVDHSAAKGGCTSCHSKDQLAPLPVSHERRSDFLCTVCHSATTTEAPLVPHSLTPQSACTSCHSPQTLPVTLNAHANPLDEACTACHRQVPGGVPSIPHTLTGRSTCTDCHTVEIPGRLMGGLSPD